MKKDVMIVTGAGQISMAIARRVGFGKKIILGDKNMKNCESLLFLTMESKPNPLTEIIELSPNPELQSFSQE